MTTYYRATFAALAVATGALAAAALLANGVAARARSRQASLSAAALAASDRHSVHRRELRQWEAVKARARLFIEDWAPVARLPEREAADTLRSGLEQIAQRQLGLVTDNALTPQLDRAALAGGSWRVQRVTLRASGKDLAALVAWLGKAEERFPTALIETCEFAANVGGSTGLTLRLAQPVAEGVRGPTPRTRISPDSAATIDWSAYFRTRVKGAVAVAFQRNPFQPAATVSDFVVPALRDEADVITPQIERTLEGRLRTVIRGPAAMIVVEGRIFRIGDELTVGPNRQKPVPAARTRIKQITSEHVIFRVTGGTPEKPIQCDVAYGLPPFLRAR